MKISKFLMMTLLATFVFTSCMDDKKKEKQNDAMDNANMEMTDEKAKETKAKEEPVNKKTVADVVKESEKHSTLLKAMKDAGIIVKLESDNPYTIFAPTNAAFGALPEGTITDWMKPENSEKLEGLLSYHIVPGNVDSAKLTDLIKNSKKGEYVLVTANDGKLTATINEAGNIILTDATGSEATVVAADMKASNGVMHSINSVLMRN